MFFLLLCRHNIGVRLIDEFLAKSQTERCANFESTANLVAKVGLKMFLGVNATVEKWNSDKTACSIRLSDNPFHVRACGRAKGVSARVDLSKSTCDQYTAAAVLSCDGR